MAGSCYRCTYLRKKPERGGYFIFTCTFWGIKTKGVVPHSVIISSIGKACPYFREIRKDKNKHPGSKDDNSDGSLDIII